MKAVLVLFSILMFTTTQVKALTCGASCTIKIEVKKAHDCCPNKEKSQKKSSQCDNHVSEVCFHEMASEGSLLKKYTENVKNTLIVPEMLLAELIVPIESREIFKSKLPDRQYLIYKSRLSLFLLKDQFLI